MRKLLRQKKLVVSVLLVAMVCVGSTMAYLVSRSGSLTNTFAYGTITTEIDEVVTDANKIVNVRSTGTAPCYVRARIVVGGVDPSVVQICTAGNQDDDHVSLIVDAKTYASWSKNGGTNSDYSTDWYYYLKVLPAGGTTDAPLLTKVYIGKNVTYDANTFSVTAYQEAVAATNESLTAVSAIAALFDQ